MQALQSLAAGKDAYVQGDNALAVRHMDEFLAQAAKTSPAGEAYYYRGRARYRQGDRVAAKSDMVQAVSLAADNNLRAGALIVLADIAYDANDMPAAEQTYESALPALDPNGADVPYVRFRLATALQRQTKWCRPISSSTAWNTVFPAWSWPWLAAQMARAAAWTVLAGIYADNLGTELVVGVLSVGSSVPPVARGRPVPARGRVRFVAFPWLGFGASPWRSGSPGRARLPPRGAVPLGVAGGCSRSRSRPSPSWWPARRCSTGRRREAHSGPNATLPGAAKLRPGTDEGSLSTQRGRVVRRG